MGRWEANEIEEVVEEETHSRLIQYSRPTYLRSSLCPSSHKPLKKGLIRRDWDSPIQNVGYYIRSCIQR